MTNPVPTKWQLAQHWAASADRATFAPMLEDLTHPCCFACGWFSEHWAKATSKASWERATLERAHIVPSSLGGPDDATNVILLCAPCHRDSPDWHDPSAMARWIAERPERGSKELEELSDWITALQQAPEFDTLLTLVGMGVRMGVDTPEGAAQDIIDVLWESAQNAGTHVTELSRGTKVAILRDAAERTLSPLASPVKPHLA